MPTFAISAPPPQPVALLASDRVRMRQTVDGIPLTDRARRGTVAANVRPGLVRRAEPGSCGPLILEAQQCRDQVDITVWGAAETPQHTRERALDDARAWIGWHDDVPDLLALTAAHRGLHAAARHIGEFRLSRLPRVHEAVGRSVLAQLVTGIEARRSMSQLAALAGEPASSGLWCWPTTVRLGSTPTFALRRCGVNLRSARALHASAVDDPQLERVRTDFLQLDGRLRAIPGIGRWTSAETRLALGDPDAVSVGDDNLPETVCHALAGTPSAECDDALMLHLLAPFAGQRGRVIQLVVRAVSRGLLPRSRRHAPRAALSAHRYW